MWALALCVLNMKYTTLLVPDRMWKHSFELIYQASPSVGSDDSAPGSEGKYDDSELIQELPLRFVHTRSSVRASKGSNINQYKHFIWCYIGLRKPNTFSSHREVFIGFLLLPRKMSYQGLFEILSRDFIFLTNVYSPTNKKKAKATTKKGVTVPGQYDSKYLYVTCVMCDC